MDAKKISKEIVPKHLQKQGLNLQNANIKKTMLIKNNSEQDIKTENNNTFHCKSKVDKGSREKNVQNIRYIEKAGENPNNYEKIDLSISSINKKQPQEMQNYQSFKQYLKDDQDQTNISPIQSSRSNNLVKIENISHIVKNLDSKMKNFDNKMKCSTP